MFAVLSVPSEIPPVTPVFFGMFFEVISAMFWGALSALPAPAGYPVLSAKPCGTRPAFLPPKCPLALFGTSSVFSGKTSAAPVFPAVFSGLCVPAAFSAAHNQPDRDFVLY